MFEVHCYRQGVAAERRYDRWYRVKFLQNWTKSISRMFQVWDWIFTWMGLLPPGGHIMPHATSSGSALWPGIEKDDLFNCAKCFTVVNANTNAPEWQSGIFIWCLFPWRDCINVLFLHHVSLHISRQMSHWIPEDVQLQFYKHYRAFIKIGCDSFHILYDMWFKLTQFKDNICNVASSTPFVNIFLFWILCRTIPGNILHLSNSI